ncbi:hypothetical protein [Phytohabitans rumicis]|uniref:hypothetical protein n=1 Tax=Phytohabitans rumicis TaxID=1076125 RepID=UPI001565122B|nr:hypothetical protein [Phytohabitans rumicis]
MGTAVAVCAAGFGALTVFSALRPAPAALPGLFDFASATWGDGLALPIMCGALVYAVRTLPAARRDAPLATAAGLLGGALGMATEAVWLRADSPRLNWTLPQAHHFTVAGWYHAAFLVLVCTGAAALWALALHRTAHAGRLPWRTKWSLAVAAAAGAAFLALLMVDARAAVVTDGRSLLGLLTGTAAILAAAGGAAARRRRAKPG